MRREDGGTGRRSGAPRSNLPGEEFKAEISPETLIPPRKERSIERALSAGVLTGGPRQGEKSVRSWAVQGLGWRAISSLVGIAGALLTTAAAARLLSGGDFAAFLLVLTTFVLGPVVVRLGLGNNTIRSVAKLVAQGEDLRAVALLNAIVRAAVVLGAVLALPVAALIMATARPDLAADVPLLGLALFLETLRVTASDVFTGLQMTVWSVVYSFQVRSLLVGLALLALLLGGLRPSFTTLLLVVVAINGTLSCSAMFGLRSIWAVPSITAPGARVRKLVRDSIPFFIADVGLFVIGRGDIWVAARILGPTHGSVYGAASTLASQLIIPLSMANLAFAPLASSLAQQERWAHVRGLARLIATAALLATAVGAAAIVVAGRQILSAAYGPHFGDGKLFLVILSIGSVATVATGPCGFVLLMSGKQSIVMRVVLYWAGAAFLLLPLGAWAFGGTGLAITSSAMTVGCNIHLAVRSWRSLGISTLPFTGLRETREAWGALKSDLHSQAAT